MPRARQRLGASAPPDGESKSAAPPQNAFQAAYLRSPRWTVGGVVSAVTVVSCGAVWQLAAGAFREAQSTSPDRRQTPWAASGALQGSLQAEIACAADTQAAEELTSCSQARQRGRCGRYVIDGAVETAHVAELRHLLEWLVAEAWGAGSGPPSVVDLHAGSISYKEQFVELGALMKFKSIEFTPQQVAAYSAVRTSIRALVASHFGMPEESLLHDLTFFSHINASKEAKTMHDEYWHSHTDTEQYGTFAYTALLYLATQHEDFEGGTFIFEDVIDEHLHQLVEPRVGRLVMFSSEAENPHRVEKVTKGVRLALTAAFTCNAEKAASIPEPFLFLSADGGHAEEAG